MPSYQIDLPDIVVVTGASSGLGLAAVSLLLEREVSVIGVDIASAPEELDGNALYRHLQGSIAHEHTWKNVHELVVSLADPESITFGFVGAAAVLTVGDLRHETEDVWRRTWEVNVLGNVLAFRELLPLLESARRSSVVMVTSVDADFGEQQLAAYASSKAALSGAVRSIALDFARTGISINLLAPGPMRGGLFEHHLASAEDPRAFLDAREARQPIGRVVPASEVAEVAMFLLSGKASAVFGSTVVADGGLTTGFDFRTGAEGSSVGGVPATASLS